MKKERINDCAGEKPPEVCIGQISEITVMRWIGRERPDSEEPMSTTTAARLCL